MKKNYILFVVVAAVLVVVTIGVTIAYLVSSTRTLENTFTVGDVNITLTETKGDTFILAPGVTITKDPTVTVKADSEDCWLFVKVQKQSHFDNYCTFEIVDGWTALSGYEGVYYKKIDKSSSDQRFKVIKDDKIFVKDTVTEEQLEAISINPKLEFTAYAIQDLGIDDVQDAWQLLNE